MIFSYFTLCNCMHTARCDDSKPHGVTHWILLNDAIATRILSMRRLWMNAFFSRKIIKWSRIITETRNGTNLETEVDEVHGMCPQGVLITQNPTSIRFQFVINPKSNSVNVSPRKWYPATPSILDWCSSFAL